VWKWEEGMKEQNLSELGKRIKAARKAQKKTQDEVAEAIGVGKTTLSQWERGLKQPGILNILNYCNFLGMTLDELLDVKRQTSLNLHFTQEEFDTILSLFDECEHESDISDLQKRLHFLKQYIKTLFSRAQSK
jgi:transcriptional regulator with XRE-family HTH domain